MYRLQGKVTRKEMDSILLIQPDPTTRHELTFLLQHSGFQVSTAADADQALAEIATTEPDVIVMDEAPISLPAGRWGNCIFR